VKSIPTHISDVSIPTGTEMRWGRVKSNFGGSEGAIQYEILRDVGLEDDVFKSWFTNMRPLQ